MVYQQSNQLLVQILFPDVLSVESIFQEALHWHRSAYTFNFRFQFFKINHENYIVHCSILFKIFPAARLVNIRQHNNEGYGSLTTNLLALIDGSCNRGFDL